METDLERIAAEREVLSARYLAEIESHGGGVAAARAALDAFDAAHPEEVEMILTAAKAARMAARKARK